MYVLLKSEFTKFTRKKDVLLILSVLMILPFILTILFKYEVGGLTLNGQLTAYDYGVALWSFLKMVFVIYIIPIYIPCVFIGKEVEQRSINILLSREKRGKILLSKIIMSIVAVTVFTITFFLVSVISYKLFLTGSKYELLESSESISLFSQFMVIVFQWLEMIFVTLISVLLNTILKSNASLVMGFAFIALQKALQNISVLKEYIPINISDFANISMRASTDLNTYYEKSLIVYGIYIILLMVISSIIWKKRDF